MEGTQALKVARIIHAVQVGAVLTLLFAAWFVLPVAPGPGLASLPGAAAAIALFLVPAAVFLPRARTESALGRLAEAPEEPGDAALSAVWLQGRILRWGLLEGACLLQGASFLLTESRLSFGLLMGLLFTLIILGPRARAQARWRARHAQIVEKLRSLPQPEG